MRECWLLELGLTDYDEALELQSRCEAARKATAIPDLLIFLEHEPVYTMGRGTDEKNLLLDRENLVQRGIKLREIRRGGDITFHGPGQLVGYPIIDLEDHGKDAHVYIRKLEQVLIRTLKHFGLEACTIDGMTGVWCAGEKIAAIGVGISRWITTHGFALNVNNDLSYFVGIIPCGLERKQVTSMQIQLGHSTEMIEVREAVAEEFAKVFDVRIIDVSYSRLVGKL